MSSVAWYDLVAPLGFNPPRGLMLIDKVSVYQTACDGLISKPMAGHFTQGRQGLVSSPSPGWCKCFPYVPGSDCGASCIPVMYPSGILGGGESPLQSLRLWLILFADTHLWPLLMSEAESFERGLCPLSCLAFSP